MKQSCATCPFRLKEPREKILKRIFSGSNVGGWTPGECHAHQDMPCHGMTDEEYNKFSLEGKSLTFP